MDEFIDCIKTAGKQGQRVRIRGGDSKFFLRPLYALAADSQLALATPVVELDTRAYHGITNYQASELVITVKAGTSLAEVEATLAEKNQMLPFEPPYFSTPNARTETGNTTIGGAIASAFAGPRALLMTGVRDFVLGVRVIDGQGRALRFGGEVMKNVAGYDVSRLMCGSRGRLGVLTELSLKVLPCPVHQQTIGMSLDAYAAHCYLQECLRQGLPISATSWHLSELHQGELRMRLSGVPAVLDDALKKMAARIPSTCLELNEGVAFWQALKNQQLPFFTTASNLWRVRCPRGQAESALPHEDACSTWYEAGGEVRWLRLKEEYTKDLAAAQKILTALRQVARVQVWRSTLPLLPRNTPIAEARQVIEDRIRASFDPHHIFV